METAECIVIGAGVVGLAVARALALAGREVIILEAEHAFGTHTSSRNSEVIHAGLYYPPGSLKAALSVRGHAQLVAFCDSHQVPYARCGKLVVASAAAQLPALEGLHAQALANGVRNLAWLDGAAARRLEPALACEAALSSPDTGIVDSHTLMLALLGDAERHGAMLAFDARVARGAVTREGIVLDVGNAAGDAQAAMSITAACVVNCAGLWAPAVAARIDGVPAHAVPPRYFAKGSYFSYAGRAPFRRLIYPIPEPGGLGVHLTLDLAGQARFGPNVEWVDTIDYSVRASDADVFYGAIRRYWPALPDGTLRPAYAGIRPKISGPGEPAADFRIDGESVHGVPGLVNLFGIESPGLTAALAIADEVAARLRG